MFFRQLIGIFVLLNAGYFLTSDMENPVLWMMLYIGLLSVVLGLYFYTRSILPILIGGTVLSGVVLGKGVAENNLMLIVASVFWFFLIGCVVIVVYWSACLVRLGKPKWALQHMSNLLSVMPNSAMLYNQRASLYRTQALYPEALADHQHALKITLDNPAPTEETRLIYHEQLAQAHLAVIVDALLSNQPELAIQQWDVKHQAIENTIYWDDILFYVALAHYQINNHSKAKALWEQLPTGFRPNQTDALAADFKARQDEFLQAMEQA